MAQKMHCHGSDGNRYFWIINVQGEGSGEYRSRHATTAGVRNEFKRAGKKVVSIKAARA